MAKSKAQKEAEAAAKKAAKLAAKKATESAAGAGTVMAFTLPDHATKNDKEHAESAADGVHREC